MISTNPLIEVHVKNSFFKVISLWKDGWDESKNTVLPWTVVKCALNIEKKYPNKRLIIWFMQPHFPFIKNPDIAPFGFTIKEAKKFSEQALKSAQGLKSDDDYLPMSIDSINLSINKIWAAYEQNLESVRPYAFELVNKLKGKTVISSDHGEAYTSLSRYIPIKIAGHPSKIHIPDLIRVPWLIVEKKGRKQTNTISEQEKIKEKIKLLKKMKDI